MLRQRVSEWTHEWEQQGWVKGIEQGIEQGIETGIETGLMKGLEKEKALLIRQIQRRFGHPVAEQVQASIMLVQDTDSLEQIGDWIVDCAEGGEFLSEFSRHYST